MSELWQDPLSKKQSNAGFRYGLAGAVIVIAINLILLLINEGEQNGDVLSWLIQVMAYFFIARSAAEAQYRANQRSGNFEYLRGVQGAGVGAALITSVLVWMYIVLRGIVRDALGFFVFVEPVTLFCTVTFDVMLALALGTWGGRMVVKHHSPDAFYN